MNTTITCQDAHHVRIGRRSPVAPPRNEQTQRGPKVSPVRREKRDRKGIVRESR